MDTFVRDIAARLARRDQPRSEAAIQGDIAQLLRSADLGLSEADIVLVESPVHDGRRIDIEVGNTVIEVKRDLRRGSTRTDALDQLAGYVRARTHDTGARYVGVLTDGVEWTCHLLSGNGELTTASTFDARVAAGDDPEQALERWLEGVMGTLRGIRPTPNEVARRLGAESSSYAVDRTSLKSLYTAYADHPSVQVKRQLWAKLLTTAFGTQFDDRDDLFIEHTLLVNTAEIVAHAVLGLNPTQLAPAQVLSGALFEDADIRGVVEQDFFDWVLEADGGGEFVAALTRRVCRFDWSAVDHDVLKVLYESVITRATRKSLGEYYTPDWLAEAVVEQVIAAPLDERVLDPACGSGTFLFHAVRRYLTAAKDAGLSDATAIAGVADRVFGMDLHPVSVSLARVTYLLAIGRERITAPDRPPIQVPVYLGDSMQWKKVSPDLFSQGHLEVETNDDHLDLFPSSLRFPNAVVADAPMFDGLVRVMADRVESPGSRLEADFRRLAVPAEHRDRLRETFAEMCRLHASGRDHIWGYYVRNLARPTWMSMSDNRVDVLIGNPPWLAYQFMTETMQERFAALCKEHQIWHGAKLATQQDLSALFVVRCIDCYLKVGGRFGFVMPSAAVQSRQFEGFRRGRFSNGGRLIAAEFTTPWDLRDIRPQVFPRASSVVFGIRKDSESRAMPAVSERWSGRISGSVAWPAAAAAVSRTETEVGTAKDPVSPYQNDFAQGASIVPRVLFMVKRVAAGPLGVGRGRVRVESDRRSNEKPPWRDVASLSGTIEAEFVKPVLLSENVLPFAVRSTCHAVIPWLNGGTPSPDDDSLDGYRGVQKWWRNVNRLWTTHRKSGRHSLSEWLDYHGKLRSQFPLQPLRVVYNKSGTHLVAAIVRDRRAVIDHSLYWGTVRSEDEARFLCAVLNAPRLTELVRPLMSFGMAERHVDKYVWQLPVPRFEPGDPDHQKLAELAGAAERLVDETPTTGNFVAVRRSIRRVLSDSAVGQEMGTIVGELLSG
jgi:SAM-dependent methyltransferase